jgi:hypothetical protein
MHIIDFKFFRTLDVGALCLSQRLEFAVTPRTGHGVVYWASHLSSETMAKRTTKVQSIETKNEKPQMTAPSSSGVAMVSPDDDAVNAALSVVTPIQCATSCVENKTASDARRTLFASSTTTTTTTTAATTTANTSPTTRDNAPAFVFPSPEERLKRKVTASEDQDVPTAKRRLIFGKLVDIKEFQPNVSKVYKIVRKLTGSIGGNGSVGPIYGELTMGSMQKMIDLMIWSILVLTRPVDSLMSDQGLANLIYTWHSIQVYNFRVGSRWNILDGVWG